MLFFPVLFQEQYFSESICQSLLQWGAFPWKFFREIIWNMLIFLLLLKVKKNSFVSQNNCGQEISKVGKNLWCSLEDSRFVLIKLQLAENSAGCLCKGLDPEISQQSQIVYNWGKFVLVFSLSLTCIAVGLGITWLNEAASGRVLKPVLFFACFPMINLQNHRTMEIARDIWRSAGPLSLLKQDHIELLVQRLHL